MLRIEPHYALALHTPVPPHEVNFFDGANQIKLLVQQSKLFNRRAVTMIEVIHSAWMSSCLAGLISQISP